MSAATEILDFLRGKLFLTAEEKKQAIVGFVAAKVSHDQLWMRYNNLVEGNWPADTAAKIKPHLDTAYGHLLKADAAKTQADALVRDAINKAIAAGKLTAEDVTGTGLMGLPVLAVAAAIIGFAAIGLYSLISLFGSSSGSAKAQVLLAEQIAKDMQAGKATPPAVIDAVLGNKKATLSSGLGSAAIIAVALAGLFLFAKGRKS